MQPACYCAHFTFVVLCPFPQLAHVLREVRSEQVALEDAAAALESRLLSHPEVQRLSQVAPRGQGACVTGGEPGDAAAAQSGMGRPRASMEAPGAAKAADGAVGEMVGKEEGGEGVARGADSRWAPQGSMPQGSAPHSSVPQSSVPQSSALPPEALALLRQSIAPEVLAAVLASLESRGVHGEGQAGMLAMAAAGQEHGTASGDRVRGRG